MSVLVAISGSSGGGKSTLVAELHARGLDVVDEWGRRLLAEPGGTALLRTDSAAFMRQAVDLAAADYVAAATRTGPVFFDRGVVDAAYGLARQTGMPVLPTVLTTYRYHPRVFFAPWWPEIYVQDAQRRHDVDAARADSDRLRHAYTSVGYELVELPKVPVPARVEFVLAHL